MVDLLSHLDVSLNAKIRILKQITTYVEFLGQHELDVSLNAKIRILKQITTWFD